MHRSTAALLVFFLTVQQVIAAPAAKGVTETAPGSSVEMPYLIAPLATDDTLMAYAYISTKIVASSPSAALAVRNRIAFIQDAFVRDVNASSIGKLDNPQVVDTPALIARLTADAKKAMKPGEVSGVQLVEVVIRPLHPSAINPGGPS